MGKKGNQTKQMIVSVASDTFNRKGYITTSMEDLVYATGIQKGGIYRHFDSKEQLALLAYRHAIDIRLQEIRDYIKQRATNKEKLIAIAQFYVDPTVESEIKGGCPIFNVIQESSKLPEIFQDLGLESLESITGIIKQIIHDAILKQELYLDESGNRVSDALLSILIGGELLSRLQDNQEILEQIVRHFEIYINSLDWRGYLT